MKPYLTSVARIADFGTHVYEIAPRPRAGWATGDYVVGELPAGTAPFTIESVDGRPVEIVAGDCVVGALGRRCATLELVGDWRAVDGDLRLDMLTSAGVLGRVTSSALGPGATIAIDYRGHVVRGGTPQRMRDFAAAPPAAKLTAPVVLIVGTSMSAGKTVAGKAVVRALRGMGVRVAAAKLTGVGRLRDVLAMGDAGAATIHDFVDVGLPSTAVERAVYEPALRRLLACIAAAKPGVVVAEAGASPLEPYNGDAAMSVLDGHVAFTILCASDPYAVLGVMKAFALTPDLVAGRATSTEAGIALVERLCGVPALNLLDVASLPALARMLGPRVAQAGSSATAGRLSA